MTGAEFLMAYNIGYRDGTIGEYCPQDYKNMQMIEPCLDAISRQAVKELYYKDEYIDFRKICALPPVNPQQKIGHWVRWHEKVEHESWEEYIPHCKCSVCQSGADPHISQFMNYCPYCGAKMQEVEDGDK